MAPGIAAKTPPSHFDDSTGELNLVLPNKKGMNLKYATQVKKSAKRHNSALAESQPNVQNVSQQK